jgi:hypothetical protein
VQLWKLTKTKTHTASLLAKPSPLNINLGSDRFSMFNKKAGHPLGWRTGPTALRSQVRSDSPGGADLGAVDTSKSRATVVREKLDQSSAGGGSRWLE